MLRSGIVPLGSYYPTLYLCMEPIYNVERNVEKARERLANSSLSDNVKEKISEFISVLVEGNGIKKHREYFYFERLGILAEILGNKILKPSKNDVIKCIAELRNRTTIRHTKYRPSTISDFKKTLKKFVKYVNDGQLDGFWSDIHAEKIGSRYKRPDQMITYEELQVLLRGCKNSRDKAIFSLLWDSGIRASELLNLRIKDFQLSLDGLYATLNISEGSKNYRQRTVVLTGDSVVLVPQYIDFLKEFLKDSYNDRGFLFAGIGKEKPGQNLTYDDLRMIVQKVKKRSGLEKEISPHLFRHSAATRMAVDVPIQVFTKQMGWTSNKMADNYTHLDTKGQIIAILKANNVSITDSELNKPLSKVTRRCQGCQTVNTGGARFCSKCGSPLRPEDFIRAEEQRIRVMEALRESNLIDQDLKASLDTLPEESKLDLLATLLLKLEKEGKLDEVKKRTRREVQ